MDTQHKSAGFSDLANGAALREILGNEQLGPALPVSEAAAGGQTTRCHEGWQCKASPKDSRGASRSAEPLGPVLPLPVLLPKNSYGKQLL